MFGVSSAAAVFLLAFFLGINHHKNQATVIATIEKPVTYTEVKAPLGARSEIKLPDGTEVILNAGSSISYSSNYNSLNREIVLEGEGYFKVARNPDLPLCVDAGNIIIKATGTEFNVKAYSDENIIETMLGSGNVEISQRGNEKNKDVVLKLEPNQKAMYARQSDRLILEKIKEIEPLAVKPASTIIKDLLVSPKTNVEVEQEISWTKNKLIIKRENLESLCTKLGRKYNVSFVFRDDEIKKCRFTGVLLDETFEQIMDAIMLVAPIDYSLNGKSVYLFSKKDLTTGTKHIQ
jgi:ferric-dicitrate binding protein FerR (iron transport regulator)